MKKETEYADKEISLKYKDYNLLKKEKDFKIDRIYFGRTSKNLNPFIVYHSKDKNIFRRVFLDDKSKNIDENEDYFPIFDEYKITYVN